MRVSYDILHAELTRILTRHGLRPERADLSARLFADASRDGIASHGLNRFPAFVHALECGDVDPNAEPTLNGAFGALERWNGNHGPGNLNAYAGMARAIALAKEHTFGVVGLSNTNHWMRAGNFGLMAVEAGCIGICWTNTLPNMPPWGGRNAKLGNNPIVFAIPNGEEPVLLDIAMSMFAYGKLEAYARQGKELPVDGGFNKEQQLTRNAAEILETSQALPFGFWKGSGLALALDLVGAAISGGRTTREVGLLPRETEISQVFMAIDLASLPDGETYAQKVRETLEDMQASTPMQQNRPVTYPGQNMMRVRRDSMANGIPVEPAIWEAVQAL